MSKRDEPEAIDCYFCGGYVDKEHCVEQSDSLGSSGSVRNVLRLELSEGQSE
jgi:hypothetical protein